MNATTEKRKTVSIPSKYHNVFLAIKQREKIPIEKTLDDVLEAGLRVKRMMPEEETTRK
jgi:DNA polymerase elongation subunit (family B)